MKTCHVLYHSFTQGFKIRKTELQTWTELAGGWEGECLDVCLLDAQCSRETGEVALTDTAVRIFCR